MKTSLKAKLTSIALGLTMALGGLVGLGVEEAKQTKAAEKLVYTLTPAKGSNNSYASNCDVTISNIKWNLTGNSTEIPWRMGGKSITNEIRSLYSKTVIADNISKIVITIGTATSITLSSAQLVVSDNSDFSSPVSTVSADQFAASKDSTFLRPDGVDWSNKYFKFNFKVTVSGSSNKYFQICEGKFYKDDNAGSQDEGGDNTPTVDSITVKTPPTKLVYNDHDPFELDGLVLSTVMSDETAGEDVSYEDHSSEIKVSPSILDTSTSEVTISYKGKTTTQTVTVNKIYVSTLKLNYSEYTVQVGRDFSLTATTTPNYVTDSSCSFSQTKGTGEVNVGKTGGNTRSITGVAVGTTKVTVKTNDGSNLSQVCNITVVPVQVQSIALNQGNISLDCNKTFQLVPTILPEDAANKNVTYSSSNSEYVSVNSTGLITALKPTCSNNPVTITATTEDQSLTATCSVTAKKPSDTYNVVSSFTDINNGDYVVIGNADASTTAGTLSSTFLTSISSTYSTDKTQIKILGENTYAFAINKKTENSKNYISLKCGDLGYLKEDDVKDVGWSNDEVFWSVTFNDSNATLKQSNELSYNGSSPRFTTYSSTQKPIQLYKKIEAEKKVTSISSVEKPTLYKDKNAEYNTCFNPSGLVLKGVNWYDNTDLININYNGNEEDFTFYKNSVSDENKIDTSYLLTENVTIIVAYGDFTTSFDITVQKHELTLSCNKTKNSNNEYDVLIGETVTVSVNSHKFLNDAVSDDIAWSCDGAEFNENNKTFVMGTTKVTVSATCGYGGDSNELVFNPLEHSIELDNLEMQLGDSDKSISYSHDGNDSVTFSVVSGTDLIQIVDGNKIRVNSNGNVGDATIKAICDHCAAEGGVTATVTIKYATATSIKLYADENEIVDNALNIGLVNGEASVELSAVVKDNQNSQINCDPIIVWSIDEDYSTGLEDYSEAFDVTTGVGNFTSACKIRVYGSANNYANVKDYVDITVFENPTLIIDDTVLDLEKTYYSGDDDITLTADLFNLDGAEWTWSTDSDIAVIKDFDSNSATISFVEGSSAHAATITATAKKGDLQATDSITINVKNSCVTNFELYDDKGIQVDSNVPYNIFDNGGELEFECVLNTEGNYNNVVDWDILYKNNGEDASDLFDVLIEDNIICIIAKRINEDTTVLLKATQEDTNATKTAEINIQKSLFKSISLPNDSGTIYDGEYNNTYQLEPIINYTGLASTKLNYSVVNDAVATVDQSGLITAVSSGDNGKTSTTVYITSDYDPNIYKTFKINVKADFVETFTWSIANEVVSFDSFDGTAIKNVVDSSQWSFVADWAATGRKDSKPTLDEGVKLYLSNSLDGEKTEVTLNTEIDFSNSSKQYLYCSYEGTFATNYLTINVHESINNISISSGDVYAKVTKTTDLTNGKYLIVYETGNFAFNSELETLDASSNTIGVTINNGTIVSNETTDKAAFTFTASDGSFLGTGGKYFGNANDTNALTSNSTALSNTVSIDDDGNFVCKSSGGAYLRYNSTSGQNRFRYYKSSTYTAQQDIQIYKLVNGTTTYSNINFGVQDKALEFARSYISSMEYKCGNTDTLTLWGDIKELYQDYVEQFTNDDDLALFNNILKYASAAEYINGMFTDDDRDVIQEFASSYDWMTTYYGTSEIGTDADFLGRYALTHDDPMPEYGTKNKLINNKLFSDNPILEKVATPKGAYISLIAIGSSIALIGGLGLKLRRKEN